MRIREATEADAEAIAGIRIRGWQTAYRGLMPDEYLDGLDPAEWALTQRGRTQVPPPGISQWVVEEAGSADEPEAGAGRVIAFETLGPARDEPGAGEIFAIYVEPSERRRGAGRLMMEHAVTHLRAEGYARCSLWVLRDNAPARRFYEAMGWRADGSEKGFELPGFETVSIPEVRYVRSL